KGTIGQDMATEGTDLVDARVTGGKARVAVVFTGGTISHRPAHRLDFIDYTDSEAFIGGADLIKRVPEVYEIADVELLEPQRIVGPELTLGSLVQFSRYLDGISR